MASNQAAIKRNMVVSEDILIVWSNHED